MNSNHMAQSSRRWHINKQSSNYSKIVFVHRTGILLVLIKILKIYNLKNGVEEGVREEVGTHTQIQFKLLSIATIK